MHDHGCEEYRIKPWEGAVETGDKTPGKRKVQVTGVVDLASIAIPAINEDRVASLSLDGAGILDSLPWKLRERLALDQCSTLLGSESVLLRIGRIPDPVHKQI